MRSTMEHHAGQTTSLALTLTLSGLLLNHNHVAFSMAYKSRLKNLQVQCFIFMGKKCRSSVQQEPSQCFMWACFAIASSSCSCLLENKFIMLAREDCFRSPVC
mmetsp:Transcript_20319/g.51314  ORF Transcript_20319/g.51314 Transcript_20319/m.51314 type:complete len:103 (-) Transcript_20319:1495-1803(-)